LAAGSVIHGCHEEQDIWKMGGLGKRMPFTALVTILGTLALCGIPPLSGFWSKDAIFAATAHSPGLALVSMAAGFFTSFFMLRMILVAFGGTPKNDAARHAHEGSIFMTAPMAVLACLTVVGGLLPVESYLHFPHAEGHEAWTLWVSLVVALAGFVPAYHFYRHATQDPLSLPALREKFYVDEFYQRVFVSTQDAFARLTDAFEGWVVRGFLVRGSGVVARASGQGLRLVQCGQVQVYAAVFILGVFLLIAWLWHQGVIR